MQCFQSRPVLLLVSVTSSVCNMSETFFCAKRNHLGEIFTCPTKTFHFLGRQNDNDKKINLKILQILSENSLFFGVKIMEYFVFLQKEGLEELIVQCLAKQHVTDPTCLMLSCQS